MSAARSLSSGHLADLTAFEPETKSMVVPTV